MTYEGHWMGDPERGANQKMSPSPDEMVPVFCVECKKKQNPSRYTICSECKSPLCQNCGTSVLMRGYEKLHETVCKECSKER